MNQGLFDEIMAFEIEPKLGRKIPSFIFDYPAPMGALARLKSENSNLAERFELYMAGMELANGFTELTDPVEQRLRFENEMTIRKKAGKLPMPMPEPFLADLNKIGTAAGIALGLDRLVMLFTDSLSIDQVVAFTPESL